MTRYVILTAALLAVASSIAPIAIYPQAVSAQEVSPTLMRGPYLQQPTEDSMTVVWADRSNAPSEVRYGLHWSAVDFDDANWAVTDCRQTTESMQGIRDSRGRAFPLYVRHTFELRNTAGIQEATLLLHGGGDYEAYINGVVVASPARVQPNAQPTDAGNPDTPHPPEGIVAFDVTNRVHELRTGRNVVAIWMSAGWLLEKASPLFALELVTADGTKRIGPGAWTYVTGYEEPQSLDQVALADYRLLRALDGHYQHKATLTGLEPGSTYAYQVATSSAAQGRRTYSLRTVPSDSNFSFVAFGDFGTGRTEASAIRNLLLRDNFDLAVVAGDVTELQGTYQNYHTTYFQPLAELVGRKPFVTVPGNGDYLSNNAEPFREIFVPPANESRPGALYFSFDYGNVHFVGLDSESITDEQVAWLREDLAANTQPWIVVYLHRAAFGQGSVHPIDEDGAVQIRRRFVPVFEEFGVDLVMNGHNAVYGRTPPLISGRVTPPYAQVAERGVVYVTTGGSSDVPSPAYMDEFHRPPLGVSVSTNHYSRVDVSECRLTITAIDISGAILDSYTIERCP